MTRKVVATYDYYTLEQAEALLIPEITRKARKQLARRRKAEKKRNTILFLAFITFLSILFKNFDILGATLCIMLAFAALKYKEIIADI